MTGTGPAPAELVVVTGPPGAGKSTVAALVAQAYPTVALVPGDAFFAFWRHGFIDPWLPDARQQNDTILAAAAAAVGTYARGGCAVVYEGVLGPWSLPAFLTATGLPSLHYAVLLPPVEVCQARVSGRRGHGFADAAATRTMHGEFAAAGLAQRHLVPDAPGDPPAVAQALLGRLTDGRLRFPATSVAKSGSPPRG
jgi:cytidylate kinase